MDNNLTKKYYKISELSEIIGVPQSTIRFWETEFPVLSPKRTQSNRRTYSPEDIQVFKTIFFLLKIKGLKIEAAKEQLRFNKKNITKRLEVIEKLENVKGELQAILNGLTRRKN